MTPPHVCRHLRDIIYAHTMFYNIHRRIIFSSKPHQYQQRSNSGGAHLWLPACIHHASRARADDILYYHDDNNDYNLQYVFGTYYNKLLHYENVQLNGNYRNSHDSHLIIKHNIIL